MNPHQYPTSLEPHGIHKHNGTTELQQHLESLRRRHTRNLQLPTSELLPSSTLDLSSSKSEFSVTLLTIVDVLRRKLWLVLLLSIVFGVIIHQWSRSRPKRYRASAVVEVVAQSPQVFTNIREVVDYHFQVQRFYATQHVILNSNTIAKQALQLVPWVLKSPSFYGLDSKKDTKHNQQIMEKLRPDAYKILKSKIIIQAILKSSLFRISVEDSDAHRAHELAMAIAEAYQEYDRLFRVRTTINAYQKIKVQREKFEKMHSELQRKLMQFRQTNNVLTTSLNDRRNLAFKRLDSLYQQMIQVILRRVTLESQLQPLLRSRKSEKLQGDLGSSFPPLLQNELYWKLKHRHSDLQLKLESMSSRYKSKHPEVERLENQLRRLNKIIIGHIALIIEGYQEQLRSTKREEKELISKVNIAKTQLKNLDRLNLTFEQLQKEEQELSKSLSFLNRRYFEIQLLKDSTATNVRVVERASQPKDPFSPRVFRDTAIGIVLSFVGLLGLFMLIELLDRSVRSLDDLEKKVGIIPLGEMPLLNRKKKQTDIELLYNPERPMTQVEEAIRAIRTNILFTGIVNKELRKILLTSPSPREGKTFLAINLAIGIAHTGKKTILIDTDMRRPRIHKVLLPNFDRSKGVSSVIVGQHSIDEAIIKTQFPNLWLLPCGPIPPSPTELLQTDGFHKFMDEVLERFDIVLFDSPPIIPITDASILASYVDGVILVSSCGITTWNALQASVRKIQSVRGKLIGCILNKFSNKYRRYHYGYYGSYGSYKTNYGYSSNEET